VIIPSQNEKDLVEIPKVILKKIQIIPVNEVEEVLKIALEGFPPGADQAAPKKKSGRGAAPSKGPQA
jgi:ATP-dependent Lon protease